MYSIPWVLFSACAHTRVIIYYYCFGIKQISVLGTVALTCYPNTGEAQGSLDYRVGWRGLSRLHEICLRTTETQQSHSAALGTVDATWKLPVQLCLLSVISSEKQMLVSVSGLAALGSIV